MLSNVTHLFHVYLEHCIQEARGAAITLRNGGDFLSNELYYVSRWLILQHQSPDPNQVTPLLSSRPLIRPENNSQGLAVTEHERGER